MIFASTSSMLDFLHKNGRALFLILFLLSFCCAKKAIVHPIVPPPPVFVPAPATPFPKVDLLKPPPDRVPALRAKIDQLIDVPDFYGTLWGIKIVSLDRNE